MSNVRRATVHLVDQAVDATAAALATLWPRSAAARESARLQREGYEAGQPCDLAFSLSFSEALDAGAVVATARVGGVTVTDLRDATRGFITVQVPSRIGAFHLSLAARRMRRLADACGGFAAEIGPVGSARRRAPAATLGDAAA